MVMNGRDGTAENVPRQWVTAAFFDVLGARILAGRTFTADDNARELPAVVLSDAFWRARFAADPAGTPARIGSGNLAGNSASVGRRRRVEARTPADASLSAAARIRTATAAGVLVVRGWIEVRAAATAIAAAIGAVVAIPLPFIGPIVGALVGGGIGFFTADQKSGRQR